MFSSALKSFSSNISANYQIAPNPTIYSGPWKVHDAKQKSTGNAASVFIFDRKTLEPRSGGFGSRSGSSAKKVHEDVIERLKREASSLARLRHPSILQVLEPVEETRSGGLMFATEALTASLSGLLSEKSSQESGAGGGSHSSRYMVEEANGSRRRRDLEIDELEIQKGLLQVAKGLEFLHESAGLVHGNLNPDAIYINAKSDWKISGLGFAGPPDSSEAKSSLPPLAVSEALYQDPRLPPSVQLNIDYTSPDFAMDSNVSSSADLFSLGLIIIALYNSPHVSPIQSHANVSTYKKLLSTPSTTPSQNNNFLCSNPIPRDVLSHVLPRLITRRPAQRMNAREFQQSQYFDNVLVSTIRFLESLPTKNANEKSQFLRGLQRVLPDFPVSVLERKLLGALLDETKDRDLLPLILQNVFGILQRIPNGRRTFPEKVIPCLKEVFGTAPGKPASQERDSKKDAGLMIVLENMKLVAENCSGMEFKDDILPLIRLGLDSPTHSLVDASIKCLPVFLPVLDFSTVKNEVFPPIATTFSRTSSLAIKVRSLEAFTVLCGGSTNEPTIEDDLSGTVESNKPSKSSILDKYTIQEKLMPSLKAIKTKEPSVMMAALKVFREVGKIAGADFVALEVLPILWSFSLGPLLNLKQFNEFMALIKTLSTKIEKEQTRKLQELSSGGDSGGFQNGNGGFSQSATDLTASSTDNARDTFERLVLGKNAGPSPGKDLDLWGNAESEAPASKQPSASAAFSWSTNNGAASKSANSSGQFGFRSITPDQKLNSIPSLQPSRQSSFTTPAFPAMQPSQPTSPTWGAQSQGASQPSPSMASLSSMAANPRAVNSPAPNYSSFSIPPPPAGMNQHNAMRSPPSNLSTMSTAFPAQTRIQSQPLSLPQQPQPKKGLDKYESLI
ncbi:hypothetical protein N7478_006759 [Penicillium angulare]|uniref:uncharacterized protein n=1 Tax=Penicillium angulare TaxID=116970 RepID=UPI00253FCD3F|nr:uncharacterized protein N7478_006759 [Penicillium angulare]KAJ5281387.1 hypothetical protein N7478_006759 [Penicillium angulare]